jgi:hypothetical protein
VPAQYLQWIFGTECVEKPLTENFLLLEGKDNYIVLPSNVYIPDYTALLWYSSQLFRFCRQAIYCCCCHSRSYESLTYLVRRGNVRNMPKIAEPTLV